MTTKRIPRPRDPIALAKLIGDIATVQLDDLVPDSPPDPTKDAAAVALGKLGGVKGGAARSKKLSAEQRSEIAKKQP